MKIQTVLENMSAKTQKKILWGIAALLVIAVIFAFSSQASVKSEDMSDAFAGLLNMQQQDAATRVSNQSLFFGLTLRKLAHIVLFAALGFCIYEALIDWKWRVPCAIGFSYLYAVLDEIHQSLSGRYGRWQDTLIDLIGIVLGVGVALLLPWLNRVARRWFYEEWDEHHPVAKRRLENCLDALSLAAVMQYVGYRFLQSTMFPFIYSGLYKAATLMALVIFGGARFAYLFARKLWADADEKAQIRRFLKFVGVCFLALPFFLVAYLHDYKPLMFIPICWMCLYDMPADLVFRWYVRVVGIMLAATVLCCLAGVVENLGYFDRIGFVEAYGMINTTDFAAYFVFLVLAAWCGQHRDRWQANLVVGTIMLAVGYYIYRMTGSRTTLICCILSAVACLYISILPPITRRHKGVKRLQNIVEAVLAGAFPVFLALLILLTYLYGKGNAFAARMNRLLTSRLFDSWNIFVSHGIRLLGNSFTMHGIGASLIRDWRSYDFLDSSYGYLLIRYGIILTVIVGAMWIWTTVRAIRNGNRKVALSMAVISAYAFSESHFVDANYNILLLMPFCAFATSSALKVGENRSTGEDKIGLGRLKVFSWISAVFLAGLSCAGLPRAISWLRTLFYLRRWNSGMRVLPAFLLCVLACGLIYIIWRLVYGIWYRRKLWPAVLLACVVGLSVSLVLVANSEIERGLTDQREALDAERETVQLILDSAEQPVYALERAELYRREIGGLTESIMTAEDILRTQEGTVITDKSHELPLIMYNGGEYVQFSKDSGLYTFDQSLINALTEAGYEAKRFYDSERLCDLEDLAQLNQLGFDAQVGLILEGPQHSLSQNRYVDQWAGDYEVRYTLSLDSNEEIDSESELACTLRVMGYKGEEIILEREVLRSEFDESGHCTIVMPYTISDTPRTEYRVYAAEGVTLCVDEIAWKRVS